MNEPTGYTALDLIGYTDRGDYSAIATYVKNDLTNYGGTKWRCLVDDTTGVTPTEGVNWTVFVAIPADTTKQIIAPVEGATSLHAYEVGEQLIYNDTLYKVIAPIAVNDALVVDTNIEVSPKTVIEQVEDLDANKMSYAVNTELGAHNLLNNGAVSQTLSNVTYTVNTDNTSQLYKSINIYADGTTNTSLSTLTLSPSNSRYKLSDFPSRNLKVSIGVGSPIILVIWYYDSGKNYLGDAYTQTVYNSIVMDIPSNAAYFEVAIRVPALTPVNNVRVYPMITTIEDTDPTYAPPTMTNRELTEAVTLHTNEPILLATAAANQTWAAQLTSLKTTYDTLTNAQKKRTFINVGTGYNEQAFANNHTGIGGFGGNICDSTGQILIYAVRMFGALASRATVSTSGTLTFTNLSTTTNSSAMTLWLN